MDYRKLYEENYGITIPSSYDIHHIDLNHDNNSLDNLLMIPHELHMRLHKCLQSGLRSFAVESMSFAYCGSPSHCVYQAEALRDYADVYSALFYWSAKKEFEDKYPIGYSGYKPYNYNEFRNE